MSLSTRPKQESTFRANASARGNTGQSRPASTGGRPVLVPARERGIRDNRQLSNRNLTRTIKGELSDAAKLDMELLNTRVNPVSNHLIHLSRNGINITTFLCIVQSKYIIFHHFFAFREPIGKILSEKENEDSEHISVVIEINHLLNCHHLQDHLDLEVLDACLTSYMMIEDFQER